MLNKVQLIGRLGKDPEFRAGANGTAVAKFSLATDEKRKDAQPVTEWHRVVLFRREAEVARDYLRKGSLIYLEGKIHYDSYENKDGAKVYTTEIIGDRFQMLDSRDERTAQAPAQRPVNGAIQGGEDKLAENDDLPF